MRQVITGFFTLFIFAIQSGSAITIRHDTPDSSYTNLANSTYPQGGLVSGSGWIGNGTLISPNWILTAGHVPSHRGASRLQLAAKEKYTLMLR